MKCEFCGAQFNIGDKFCGKCGEKINLAKQTDETSELDEAVLITETEIKTETKLEHKSSLTMKDTLLFIVKLIQILPFFKLIKIVAFPLILLIVLFAFIVTIRNSSNFYTIKNDMTVFKTVDGGIVISTGNNNKFSIEEELHLVSYSLDKSKCALLSDYDYEMGGALWYISDSEKIRVAEDVLYYRIADSGNGIAYLTEFNSENFSSSLYLYDSSAKKNVKVAEDVYWGYSGVSISPDGKSVGYISDYNDSDKQFSGYIKIDGKPAEKIGNNVSCIAISDNGTYIYYSKQNVNNNTFALYVKKGTDTTKLIPDVSSSESRFFFNKDYSQIMFNYNEYAYISNKGGDKEKISNILIGSFVLPQYTQISSFSYVDIGTVVVCGFKNFSNTVISAVDGSLAYMNKNYKITKITTALQSNINNVFWAPDAKTLLFIDNSERLCKINLKKPDTGKETLAENVFKFVPDYNGKNIYFINNDQELWFMKNNINPSKISDDVYLDCLAKSKSSRKVFFMVDYRLNSGTLYYSSNGNKKTKVQGADDCSKVFSTATNIFYYTNYSPSDYSCDVLKSDGNEYFVKFHEGII